MVEDGALNVLGTVGFTTVGLEVEIETAALVVPVALTGPVDVGFAQPYGQEAVTVGRVTTEAGPVAVKLEPAVTVIVGRVTTEAMAVVLLANGAEVGIPEIEALGKPEMLATELALVPMMVAVWLLIEIVAVETEEEVMLVPLIVTVLFL